MAKERQVSSASAKLVDLGASLLSSHLPRSLFGPSAGAAAAANASIPTTGSTNIVPFSALITSLASLVAAGVVASLSPLWAAFGEMSFAEWGTVVLPPLAYWLYSGFLYYIPPLFPSFTEKYRLHPTTERINRVSPGEVVRTVIVQHLIQMTVALIVAVLTRGQGSPDSWPVIGLKLAVGAFILDGYEYWIHRWMHTNPYLYRTIHSVHHRLSTNYSFGALYNHPLEGLLLDTIGGGLASILTFMNPETACVFYVLSTMKTVDDHCGYVWPWMRVFGNHAGYHDVHHWNGGLKFNFSQPYFTFWDDICGTRWTGPLPSYVGDKPAPTSIEKPTPTTPPRGRKGSPRRSLPTPSPSPSRSSTADENVRNLRSRAIRT